MKDPKLMGCCVAAMRFYSRGDRFSREEHDAYSEHQQATTDEVHRLVATGPGIWCFPIVPPWNVGGRLAV
jgi:hypothetical protein